MTSVADAGPRAFGFSARNLGRRDSLTFAAGRPFFNEPWQVAAGTTSDRDGLGPTFNADSCTACHVGHGRGQVPVAPRGTATGLLLRLSVPGVDAHGGPAPEPIYGVQLQDRSTGSAPPEGRVLVSYEPVEGTYAEGTRYVLQRPIYTVTDLQFGPLTPGTMISPRLAPALIGLGLLEAIPAEEILAGADPDDADGDGISGRPNLVWDHTSGTNVLGRFGWKASQPSVAQQTAAALHQDLGVTNPLFPSPNCPPVQLDCSRAPLGGDPEASAPVLEKLTFYTRTLAVPLRRPTADGTDRRGAELFAQAGCASCHRPSWTTGDDPVNALRGQTIRPYTDLLLHDLGPELADGRPEFLATGSEWRTAPLWGIGLAQQVTPGTGFLHDGRARTLAEAILWHGGEAERARERFRTMDASDRDALLAFLSSL
jgi:CxxC motif-containing protein (DUF1111 family)